MTAARRVLLVEDEPGLVMTLTDRLKSEGYRVEAAREGDGALEMATAEPFDVILLDVMLPGRSGFDVCRELRARGVDTPILFLSARGEIADKIVGLQLGADDYLNVMQRLANRQRRGVPSIYLFARTELD